MWGWGNARRGQATRLNVYVSRRYLYVDAALGDRRNNGKGFGAVLLQDRPRGVPCPVAFLSRKLTKSEENYPAGLAELRAIHWATDKLEIYLKHRPFHLYCDHKPLTDKMMRALGSRNGRKKTRRALPPPLRDALSEPPLCAPYKKKDELGETLLP